MVATVRHRAVKNQLLATLKRTELASLLPLFEPVMLDANQHLLEPDEPVRHVYFPLNAVVSLVVILEDGRTIEVATVGSEGVVGLAGVLSGESMPFQSVCQVPGEALRAPARRLRGALVRQAALDARIRLYTQALLTQAAQSAACSQSHSIVQRAARWLLATCDRARAAEFQVTHEVMSTMLGVRRPSVTAAARELQRAGLIEYRRGLMRVRDPDGLERSACECYRVVRREYERLLGDLPACPR